MRCIKFQFVAVLLVLTLYPFIVFSAIYKWVDENGVITFKDTPPPAGVQGQMVDASPSFSGGGEAVTGSGIAPVKKTQQQRVEIFITDWCPYCKSAINFLRANNIPFTQHDIEKNPSAARRKDQLDSKPGVPFAVINGKKIHGFDPYAYREALGLRGL